MCENQENLKSKFDQIAQDYDEQRRKLIPCFDDFYATAVSLASLTTYSPRILDLGAGTGLMAGYLINQYPNAHITLIDLSEGMLDIAKLRFKNHSNVTYIAADYTKYDFTGHYDLVISSLSIHHLEDMDKKNLYNRIYTLLHKNGLFINADQVLGNTKALDELYKSDWHSKVGASGLTAQALAAAHDRTKLDRMATLDEQLAWLRAAGFTDVDCVYKYFNFVVMLARKE